MAFAQAPSLLIAAALASTLAFAVRRTKIFLKKRNDRARCIIVQQPTQEAHFKAVLLPLSRQEAQNCLVEHRSLQYTYVVGVDCEWQPEKGRNHSPVSLLQFAPSEDTCFLAQLLYMDSIPEQIRYILQDPLVVKVGIGVREDVKRLTMDYSLTIRSVVDLVDVIKATQPSLLLGGCSLAAISKALLQLEVDKSYQCSDWGNRQLSKQQVRYAALDAWLPLRLAGQLHRLLISQQQRSSLSKEAAVEAGVSTAEVKREHQPLQPAVPEDLAVFLSQYVIKLDNEVPTTTKQQQLQQGPKVQQYIPAGPSLPLRKQTQQQAQQLPVIGAAVAQQQWQHYQQQWQQWQLLNSQQQIQLLHQKYQYLYGLNVLGDYSIHTQQRQRLESLQQRRHSTSGTVLSGPVGKQQQQQQREWQQQQQQERRQRQLEQLQRLGQQAAAPTRSIFDKMQNLKPARLPTRKSLQYENCRIIGPDGKALATCGAKKVKWYLDRGLAEVVEEEPTIAIRLKFKPRGSGHADDQYYLSDKDNKCVVCGHEGEYLRHSIVPHCYRQHFPQNMKSHLSHDIVLMCVGCHQICNILDQKKMQEIGVKYGAPLEDESRRFRTDRHLAQVRSAARALLNPAAAGKIPPARVEHLRSIIMQHFCTTKWDDSLVTAANEVEPSREEEGWASHGSVVVAALMASGKQQQQQQQQHTGKGTGTAASAGGATLAKPILVQQQHRGMQQQVKQSQQQQQQQQDAQCMDSSASVQMRGQNISAGVSSEYTTNLTVSTTRPRRLYEGVDAAFSTQAIATTSQAAPSLGANLAGCNHSSTFPTASDGVTAAAAADDDEQDASPAAAQQEHSAPAACWAGIGGMLAFSAAAAAEYSSSTVQEGVIAVVTAAQDSIWISQKGIGLTEDSIDGSRAVQYGFHSVLCAVVAAGAASSPAVSASQLVGQESSCSKLPESLNQSIQGTVIPVTGVRTRRRRSSHSTGAASARGTRGPSTAEASAEAALGEFIRDWRRHFLEVMQPKFLPPFWSVDARVKNSSGTDMPGPGELVHVMDLKQNEQQVVIQTCHQVMN